MYNQILTQEKPIVKVRPNLWQAPDGAVVGFGAVLAPGGLYFCFTCGMVDCEHTQAVDGEWLAGRDSAENDAIPFCGEPAPCGDFDGDELIFALSADLWPDDYGLPPEA